MIVVNLPGGGVQPVGETELLWLRKAFDSEWKGATMLRLRRRSHLFNRKGQRPH